MTLKRSMWHYRNMHVKMVAPRPHIFRNIDEASNILDTSKFLIHQSISNNIPLYGVISLVYINPVELINSNILANVENNNQRGIPRDITGEKRPRCETDDHCNNVRKTRVRID